MKNLLILLSFVFAFTANAQTGNVKDKATEMVKEATKMEVAETKTVDTEGSVATWKGHKVTGTHEGTIAVKEGKLTYDADGMLNGGTIIIDMTSITCTDLEGEMAGKLVGHLASPDFFNVADYPTATLEILKVAHKGMNDEYKITGNLTIKETTEEVKFYATVGENAGMADIQIDRTDFDIRYGSSSFFGFLGDKTIYDEFDLNVKFSLK